MANDERRAQYKYSAGDFMIKENALKLVAALRSGKFNKGKNKLETLDGIESKYCCLGVACLVAETEGVPVERDYNMIVGTYLNKQEAVAEWLGIKYSGKFAYALGVSAVNHYGDSLASLNDDGLTFAEIANFIEKHWDVIT
mgnify:CR=1 FL=1